MKRLLAEIPDDIGINYNSGNLSVVGYKNLEEFYIKNSKKIIYAHLKDFIPIENSIYFKPGACGEGPVNWKKVMNAMKKFEGPSFFEYEMTDDVEDVLKRTLKFIKECCK